MFSLQPFFFLFLLLSTSLISFSLAETLDELSKLPIKEVTKERFQICLEGWLGHLKEWSDVTPTDVEHANKIAQDLGLTGKTKDTSLQLSDPSDNTQPAPWAWGLSLVLLKASEQFRLGQEPTLLMPEFFVPDGQVFHFTMLYEIAFKKIPVASWMYSHGPVYSKVFPLAPKPDVDVTKERIPARLDIAYLQHNRDGPPKRMSLVNDLSGYVNEDQFLRHMRRKLMDYPWLRNYVKFGENALRQLLDAYKKMGEMHRNNRGETVKISDVEVWLNKQLDNVERVVVK